MHGFRTDLSFCTANPYVDSSVVNTTGPHVGNAR